MMSFSASSQPHEADLSQLSTPLDKSSDNTEVAGTSGFACPFFRKEPTQHMDCAMHKLMRVCDVKQHIQRRHIKDLVSKCPICELVFKLPSERDAHESLSICSFAEPSFKDASDAVEKSMLKKLRARSRRGMTYADLCGILFGEEGKSLKPYLEPIGIETSGMVRNFWQCKRESILQAFALTNGRNIFDEVINELLLQFEQRIKNPSLAVTAILPAAQMAQDSQETIVEITAFSFDSYNTHTSLSMNEGAEGIRTQFSMSQDWPGLMTGPYDEQLDSIAYTDVPQRNEDTFSFLGQEIQNTFQEFSPISFDQHDSEDFENQLEQGFQF